MIGGEHDVVEPPGSAVRDDRPRARGAEPDAGARRGDPSQAEQGYLHCGPNGAGHFVKMVHNGIEYGIMAAYAEGMNILRQRERRQHRAGARRRDDAAARPRVLPLRHRHGRGLRSLATGQRRRLVAARPDRRRPPRVADLDGFHGRVSDSGEGRWTVLASVDEGVPGPRADRRPLRPLQLARRRRLRQQAALGDARPVRRACRRRRSESAGRRRPRRDEDPDDRRRRRLRGRSRRRGGRRRPPAARRTSPRRSSSRSGRRPRPASIDPSSLRRDRRRLAGGDRRGRRDGQRGPQPPRLGRQLPAVLGASARRSVRRSGSATT